MSQSKGLDVEYEVTPYTFRPESENQAWDANQRPSPAIRFEVEAPFSVQESRFGASHRQHQLCIAWFPLLPSNRQEPSSFPRQRLHVLG